jgi:hypothetical protein
MAIVTIRHRILFEPNTLDENVRQILQIASEALKASLLYRYWKQDNTLTLEKFKQKNIPKLKELNIHINEYSDYFIKQIIKPRIEYLSDDQQLSYTQCQVELNSVDFSDINTLTLIAYYYSIEYKLIESFGPHLLLTIPDNDNKLFSLELNNYLSINSYKL